MQKTIQYIKKELGDLYPPEEVDGFIRIIMEDVAGVSYTQMVLQKEKHLYEAKSTQIENIVLRLKTFEPIQYILGKTEFFNMELKVNSGVLIPRPETEELVDWILNTALPSELKIIDIGTGSGCIALALKKRLKNAGVCAVDFSETALETAQENAKMNKLDVGFKQVDILKWQHYEWPMYDVIVSNPPYVRELEKEKMHKNVLDHEPDGALFVSNNNPLVFYQTIGEFAQKFLKPNGFLFFEINEYLGFEMEEMLKSLGFRLVEIRKDLNNKDRMLRCQK